MEQLTPEQYADWMKYYRECAEYFEECERNCAEQAGMEPPRSWKRFFQAAGAAGTAGKRFAVPFEWQGLRLSQLGFFDASSAAGGCPFASTLATSAADTAAPAAATTTSTVAATISSTTYLRCFDPSVV
eukprot:g20527.t1